MAINPRSYSTDRATSSIDELDVFFRLVRLGLFLTPGNMRAKNVPSPVGSFKRVDEEDLRGPSSAEVRGVRISSWKWICVDATAEATVAELTTWRWVWEMFVGRWVVDALVRVDEVAEWDADEVLRRSGSEEATCGVEVVVTWSGAVGEVVMMVGRAGLWWCGTVRDEREVEERDLTRGKRFLRRE
jgi:hypothetical protein